MVRSVEEILQKEFGRSLGDKGVHILDPFVGTGNFIIRIMQEIKTTDLPYKYENELHCNEVMLLPYYIASMNIEHAYFDRTGEYKPFSGICLVDTFELAEAEQAQLGFMTAENAERVKRQKRSPIFVIIANPPYNAKQLDENDNNKNRKYRVLDKRVADTYSRDSDASNKNSLSDVFVKAFRWASDRIGSEGVIAFVSNNSFLDKQAFDGMRKHLSRDFTQIYHLDLKGDARTAGEPRRREGGNVFDDAIRVGVGISLLVRSTKGKSPAQMSLYSVADYADSETKRECLSSLGSTQAVPWAAAYPDKKWNWTTAAGSEDSYQSLLPLVTNPNRETGVFDLISNGVKTNRDNWARNYGVGVLTDRIQRSIQFYNSEIDRWRRAGRPKEIDDFVMYDETNISWSRDLKKDLERERYAEYSPAKIRESLYRPYTRDWLFFDRIFNEEVYAFPRIFPVSSEETENRALCIGGYGRRDFATLCTNRIPDVNLYGDPQRSVPFYTYAKDGTARRDNITDWALEQFRSHYSGSSITRWDIFHYVYAVLHHPEYRERYAANLRRELPRIPFVSANSASSAVKDLEVFRSFTKIGKRLAEIHVHYEKQPEYKLKKIEKPGEKLDYRVTKMRLSKDKAQIAYNDFLTLSGIPPETFEYRLGNRSALDWIIDQYQVSTDKRSGITNDPNRSDDPTYILRLIGQVITVSLETVSLVRSLPPLGLPS